MTGFCSCFFNPLSITSAAICRPVHHIFYFKLLLNCINCYPLCTKQAVLLTLDLHVCYITEWEEMGLKSVPLICQWERQTKPLNTGGAECAHPQERRPPSHVSPHPPTPSAAGLSGWVFPPNHPWSPHPVYHHSSMTNTSYSGRERQENKNRKCHTHVIRVTES